MHHKETETYFDAAHVCNRQNRAVVDIVHVSHAEYAAVACRTVRTHSGLDTGYMKNQLHKAGI